MINNKDEARAILTGIFGVSDAEVDNLFNNIETELFGAPLGDEKADDSAADTAAYAETAIPKNAFTISVGGQQGAGKTTLLLFILTALAQAGVLSMEDTAQAALDPLGLLERLREMDGTQTEAVELRLDQRDVREMTERMLAAGPAVVPYTVDEALVYNSDERDVFEANVSSAAIATKGWVNVIGQSVADLLLDPSFVVDADTTEVMIRVRKAD